MSQQLTAGESVFARRMTEGEIRAAVGSFHPNEIAVVLFSINAGVVELMQLGDLHRDGDIEILPLVPNQALVESGIGWGSRRARQRAFRVTMQFTWQKFWEKFPDPSRFVNITVIAESGTPVVCE